MNNRFAFFTFTVAFFVGLVVTSAGRAAKTAEKTLLPDGFILRGAEGKLVSSDANEGWGFELYFAVKRDKDILKAGTNLKLLPSSTLERMLADANDRPSAGYRLWARVTKYKDRNFIFPEYFLLLSDVKQPQPIISEPNDSSQRRLAEPEQDELAIPKQILEKLESRRTVPRRLIGQQTAIKQNYVLANRTGFIRDSGHVVFVFNAFGRSIQQTSLRLLPCQALELAEQEQSAEPDPIRFKIAGIVAEYKGQCFLLLQQATRVYSHDNFGR